MVQFCGWGRVGGDRLIEPCEHHVEIEGRDGGGWHGQQQRVCIVFAVGTNGAQSPSDGCVWTIPSLTVWKALLAIGKRQ